MFLHRVRIFTLAGFTVWIDASWLIFAALIVWTLASGVFPALAPHLPAATYWWMGIAGAIGFFFSIVFHEMSHSLVARRFSMPIAGITLFIFGGVAELHQEPTNAKAEFWMALAGPVSSMVLGTFLLLIAYAIDGSAPVAVVTVTSYLGWINWFLALFNLLPAFPLDGGRIFRAALWWRLNDFAQATRIATTSGKVFGFLLIALGVYNVFGGNFIGGIWLFLIGMFLNGAAGAARQQLVISQALSGRKVSSLVNQHPATVSPDMSLRTLVEDYFYRYHARLFPVVRDGKLTACISAANVRQYDESRWDNVTVGEAAQSCSPDNTIAANADAMEALTKMQRTHNDLLLVVDKGQLEGVLSLADMLQFLSISRELEQPRKAA